jgi:AcrR family transcriptional regulator
VAGIWALRFAQSAKAQTGKTSAKTAGSQMKERATPRLSRDDPDAAPLIGNIKVTREDWLNLARDVLVHDGVGELKILSLADRLNVSRSSFYWYFDNRSALLNALLDEWEQKNTQTITRHCALPAQGINEAACNFFRCFVDPALFDTGLDFAVREWSRRDAGLRARVDAADDARLSAVVGMFLRHGYAPYDADARARILYFMQLGYHALDVRETLETRMKRLEGYLLGFTGIAPDKALIDAFADFAESRQTDPAS